MSASTANAKVPTFAKFMIGGISGVIAQTVTHPMDVLKICMQVSRSSLRKAILRIHKKNGIGGFYTGLSGGLLRQMTYTTSRLGIYMTLLDVGERHFGRLNYATMFGLGMTAGVMGSFVGTPTDIVMIRMVADIYLPPEKRRNYKNALNGIIDIWKNEGFFKLWRGALPTMGRAAIVNGAQLGTYTRLKMLLEDRGYIKNDMLLQFAAAMISSVVTSFVSIPIDTAKTRIQNLRDSKKSLSLAGMMRNIVKTEGALSLWRGFLPYYSRAAPNTVITMIPSLTVVYTACLRRPAVRPL
ncbi:mitochondrial 2-oxoglutarate/malate carrier protein-like [Pseudomyrmex gracilis]|uniref:mitochondrial 2-oxoglutarate/malate carrier protein-like n=1 Tax=Pseudomyrmex gracilis TaxID=219809 RepID=UPI0009952B02|nr:mitochondrial 2-oxoglutarate/malate carrier protein-like [Pseudomyrmex gracilis]